MKKITFILISILILISACSKEEGQANNNDEGEQTVKITEAEKRQYSQKLELTGTLKPYKETNIGAILPGRVEKFYYDEGDYIEKGELIAKLAGEKLTQAKVEYEVIKKDYQRIKNLYEKESVSKQKYDHIKGEYKAKKANYEMIKDNTEIRAPFDGVLAKKMISEKESFMLMNPGLKSGFSRANGIVRFMKLNKLKIAININQKYLPNINKGQKAIVTADVYPEKKYTAKIIKISQMINKSTRTAEVILEIENDNRKLKPGMFCNVNLELSSDEQVFIPQDAILYESGQESGYVFILKDGRVYRKEIQRIATKRENAVVKGVSSDDMIVVEGKQNISDGDSVEVVNKTRGQE